MTDHGQPAGAVLAGPHQRRRRSRFTVTRPLRGQEPTGPARRRKGDLPLSVWPVAQQDARTQRRAGTPLPPSVWCGLRGQLALALPLRSLRADCR